MKILHLIDSGGMYGAEMMLISLVAEQIKLGHQPVIGSIRKPGLPEKPIEEAARRREIEVHPFSMRPGLNLLGAVRIANFAQKMGFEVVHSHGYKTNVLLGFIPGRLRTFALVSTLHGWTATGKWTKMRLNEELDALSLRCVDRIVLVNQGMLEKPRIQSLPQKKVSIVNNGIELLGADGVSLDRVSGETSIEVIRAFCENKVVVASIGRLSFEKGFSSLVEAVAKVRQELGEDVRLMLVGDGRLREELQQQAENCGLKESFLITGYMKNARELLSLVDVYAISSLTEGLPITLLEAMDCGTPIVATAVGGIPFVVQDKQDALLVPSMDAQALGDALGTIIRDGALAARLVEKASEKVSGEFSSGHMAKQYQSVYENLLSGS